MNSLKLGIVQQDQMCLVETDVYRKIKLTIKGKRICKCARYIIKLFIALQ